MMHTSATPSLSSPRSSRPLAAAGAEIAASARGLSRTYGAGATAVHAIHEVDLDLPRGRYTAVMGRSGSGKSTLMHCLAGLDEPTAGTVTIAGTTITGLGDDDLTRFRRDHLGFVFQAFNLLPMLTARQNVLLPLELGGRRIDSDVRARLAHVVEVLDLGDRLDHRPGELSGGQQQRVAIARALVSEPDLVFADEPTGNLDSETSAEVLGLLGRGVHELGQTVVMVTHELEAAAHADDVVVLADGRVREHLRSPDAATVARALLGPSMGSTVAGGTR